MISIKEIVIEAENPPLLPQFWAQLLTGFDVRSYDPDEGERLASIGRTSETDPTVAVNDSGLTMFFLETTRPRGERGRIHLDLVGDDRNGEVDRAVSLGATIKTVADGYNRHVRESSSASRIRGRSHGRKAVALPDRPRKPTDNRLASTRCSLHE